ncbi:putative short-chain dehydrogenase [Meredithblackwellia eburnea MCA 4105]
MATQKLELGFHTTGEEAAEYLKDHIKGKHILLTGPSIGGLGYEVLRCISHHEPALLVLAGFKITELEEAERLLKEGVPSLNTRLLNLDLSSLASAKKAGQEVLAYSEPIDVLINNAGIMACPFARTVDGYESQFGINHLGHFMFTTTLLPKLLQSKSPRVVQVSSRGHHRSPVLFGNTDFNGGKDYQRHCAYGQAKSANALFALGLAQRYGKDGLLAFSLTPGRIVTPLFKHMDDEDYNGWIKAGELDENRNPIAGSLGHWKTVPEGTSTHIFAAFDPSIASRNGGYLQDCVVDASAVKDYASSKENAEKLWVMSEEMIKRARV